MGFIAGIVSGFFGAGGGMILVPFMTLIAKDEEVRSRATPILCIFFMVLVSSFFYYKQKRPNCQYVQTITLWCLLKIVFIFSCAARVSNR